MKNIRLLIVDDDEHYMVLLSDLLKESELNPIADDGNVESYMNNVICEWSDLKFLEPRQI